MSDQQSPRCPQCDGRLFQESEPRGNRLIHFWECSLGCSRQYGSDGRLMSRLVGERRVSIVRELIPVI